MSKEKRHCRIEMQGVCRDCGNSIVEQYTEWPSTSSIVIVGTERLCKHCDTGVHGHAKGPMAGKLRKEFLNQYGTWLVVVVDQRQLRQAEELALKKFGKDLQGFSDSGAFYSGTKGECWGLAQFLESKGIDVEVARM